MGNAPIAQLVELLALNEKVPGSNPGGGTCSGMREVNKNGAFIPLLPFLFYLETYFTIVPPAQT